MNQFEHKIDELFSRKRLQALALKKQEDDPIQESSAELKCIPFNVSTVLRQIDEETERRAKTFKRGGRQEYKNYDACD